MIDGHKQKAAGALATTRGARGQYHCSFCGKRREECVDLCREIINEEFAPLAATAAKGRSRSAHASMPTGSSTARPFEELRRLPAW